MKKYFLLFALFLIFPACSSDESKCSNAANIDDPECRKDIPDITERPVSLEVTFADSVYYDKSSGEWIDVTKDQLAGGLIPETVPIYSDFLNLTKEAALEKILVAEDQKENSGNYSENDFSQIPYIKINVEEGVDYIYNYVKRNLNNQIIYEYTGSVLLKDGHGYIPLVNAMFNNNFYPSSSNLGSRFINSIAIAAQSANRQGTKTLNIEFESLLRVPNVDYGIKYSQLMNEHFDLKNRFYHYYNNVDGNANDNFHFFTLKDRKATPEQIPLDIRVIFQEPPKLEMIQELFMELPLNLEALKTNNEVIVSRGNSFYVKRSEIDSSNDFKMKIKMNGQEVTLLNQREFILNNVPAGTPWDIDFYYDFNQNSSYTSLSGKPLITPLKPVCNLINGTAYQPIQETTERQTVKSSGGFLSICHPDENRKLIIPANDMASTTHDLTDTWFDFFSYAPYREFSSIPNVIDLGHFNGIRKITFKMEGCVRVYSREVGNPTYELKTNTSQACAVSGGSNEGWSKFYAEKTFTIFDYISDYEGINGLKDLIQSFGSQPIRSTPHFRFNGDVNEVNHVY